MDKVHAYIKEYIDLYREESRDTLLKYMATSAGMFWIEDELEPWERDVHWPEFELLSAFDFLRPELPPEQVKILDKWIAKYAKWRDQGIFFERYRESWGSKFTWEQERRDAEEELGRLIPRSHWWFWPPDMRK
jgi:hypothetical protein